ncbi:hypothetical protein BV898_04987 [Hypsibius exemplaris]|uniref:Tudor domain-containing protein n=1 Tax=Hypsibius exemplaris TaxID=2072580 RepID=A0A1W0X0U1_HYPEX|nr:hypothetical protein BV898_04987 [Hypsibius exemplaris]
MSQSSSTGSDCSRKRRLPARLDILGRPPLSPADVPNSPSIHKVTRGDSHPTGNFDRNFDGNEENESSSPSSVSGCSSSYSQRRSNTSSSSSMDTASFTDMANVQQNPAGLFQNEYPAPSSAPTLLTPYAQLGNPAFNFSLDKIRELDILQPLQGLLVKLNGLRLNPSEMIPDKLFEVIVWPNCQYCNIVWISGMTTSQRKTDFQAIVTAFGELLAKLVQSTRSISIGPLVGDLLLFNPSVRSDSTDCCCYRARICAVIEYRRKYRVLLVDCGRVEDVQFDELFPLTADGLLHTATFPALAVRCKLSGLAYGFVPYDLEAFENERYAWFCDLSAEQSHGILEAKVVPQRFLNADLTIELFRGGMDMDIVRAHLLDFGKNPPPLEFRTRAGTEILVPGPLQHASIRIFKSPTEVYIWPDDANSTLRQILQMSANMAEKRNQLGPSVVTRPEEGSCVSVRCKEGIYHRAVVLEVRFDDAVRVFCLDLGKEDLVRLEALFPLDQSDLFLCHRALGCNVTWIGPDGRPCLLDEATQGSITLDRVRESNKQINVTRFWKRGDEYEGFEAPEDMADIDLILPSLLDQTVMMEDFDPIHNSSQIVQATQEDLAQAFE